MWPPRPVSSIFLLVTRRYVRRRPQFNPLTDSLTDRSRTLQQYCLQGRKTRGTWYALEALTLDAWRAQKDRSHIGTFFRSFTKLAVCAFSVDSSSYPHREIQALRHKIYILVSRTMYVSLSQSVECTVVACRSSDRVKQPLLLTVVVLLIVLLIVQMTHLYGTWYEEYHRPTSI